MPLQLDPIAFHLGPLAIRWYALAYIAGILLGWYYIKALHKRWPLTGLTPKAMEDMITYAVVGIILGGRLGYVLFYKPDYYLENPLHALMLWEGGMSFHGGLLGVLFAYYLYCKRFGIRYLAFWDLFAPAVPIGLCLGRIANFVNGELYGRVTESRFGIVFPEGGPLPRHPSQLYEAGLEGIVLFCVLFYMSWFTRARAREGLIAGTFLAGYGLSRIIAEFFREPDAYLGYLAFGATMGQLLSLPMLLLGVFLMARAARGPATAA